MLEVLRDVFLQVVHVEVRGLGDDLQFLHLGGGILEHLLGTGAGEGVLGGDDEVGLVELLDNLRRQEVVPLRRTRIFPWQPPQTLHDSINIGLYLYVRQNCCTFAPSYIEV